MRERITFDSRTRPPEDGMVKSYNEIVRLLGAMGKQAEGFVFEGSRGYLPEGDGYVDSPAARDLVKKAMARTPDNPLFVVAIGAITNVASAIRMEPAIVDKIHVIWLGGNPLTWTTAREFNLMQDVPAACTVFDCGCAVTLVPCLGVASHLLTTVSELEACIGGKNDLCDALCDLFAAYSNDHFACSRIDYILARISACDPEAQLLDLFLAVSERSGFDAFCRSAVLFIDDDAVRDIYKSSCQIS